ncbi:MAG: histidine phosphatase family protein [Propionicimonas sp.]|uniref:histidine phosphatase family protein n=1 Tax=Propionicimonas sp. TaxID=1955623 RepID=UPI003D0A311B
MRLILVRHGRTTSNVGFLLDTAAPGADLDETGREQAEGLVERLAGFPIEAIYTSNLVRTQQTAAPLARRLGLGYTVLPGLREVSAGDDEMSADATRYIGTMVAWHGGDVDARVPGGENATEFLARFDAAIDEVAAADHAVAMVVSHGAALRTWATARVPGFDEALGKGHLENTGIIIADGAPDAGWTLVELDGVRSYWMPDDAEQGDPVS